MHYINLRFTYLLIYLLTYCLKPQDICQNKVGWLLSVDNLQCLCNGV